jgi:hypothetical protein
VAGRKRPRRAPVRSPLTSQERRMATRQFHWLAWFICKGQAVDMTVAQVVSGCHWSSG